VEQETAAQGNAEEEPQQLPPQPCGSCHGKKGDKELLQPQEHKKDGNREVADEVVEAHKSPGQDVHEPNCRRNTLWGILV
jgi:hypothetical protein